MKNEVQKDKKKDMCLSIITINRNNAFGLEKTMQSVAAQTFKEFEYIVVDGKKRILGV